MDDLDKKEFNTVVDYLEGKYNDLSKKRRHRTVDDSPKQLLQMINTVKRAIALADRPDLLPQPSHQSIHTVDEIKDVFIKHGQKVVSGMPWLSLRGFKAALKDLTTKTD